MVLSSLEVEVVDARRLEQPRSESVSALQNPGCFRGGLVEESGGLGNVSSSSNQDSSSLSSSLHSLGTNLGTVGSFVAISSAVVVVCGFSGSCWDSMDCRCFVLVGGGEVRRGFIVGK